MKTIKKAVLILFPLLLAGCFQVEQTVTVGTDGSGTVEETLLVSRRISESMEGLVAGLDGQGESAGDQAAGRKKQEPAPQRSFFKDEEIRKRAETMGEGVSFVRMERIANEEFEGYRALFAFRDINKLTLSQGGGPSQAAGSGAGAKGQGIRFVFTPGKNATLVLKQRQQKAAAGEGEAAAPKKEERPVPAGKASAEDLAMLRQMFAGLRFAMTVVVKGEIVETNATHRDGSRVTLADIDLGRMLDKPELLTKLAEIPPGDSGAALEMLKKIPGMKADLNDELRITFR
jgi:hypothetical protein